MVQAVVNLSFAEQLTKKVEQADTAIESEQTGAAITIRNLRRVARELGETMTDEELQEMVDRADSNGDSAVTSDDFYNSLTKKTFV